MSLIVSETGGDDNLPADEDNHKTDAGFIKPLIAGDSAPTASRTFDRIGTAADEYIDADANNAGWVEDSGAGAEQETVSDSLLSRIVPILLLLLLIIIGYAFCSQPPLH